MLTNQAGAVTGDELLYDAFGNLVEQQGNTPLAHGYTGEWFDDDLGLYYLRVR